MTTHQKWAFFLLNAVTGGLFSYFFYDHTPGISVLAFVIVCYVSFFAIFRKVIDTKQPMAWFLMASGLVLAVVHAIYNHPLTYFNILLIPLTFLASTILFTGNNTYRWFDPRSLLDLFPHVFGRSLENLGKPFKLLNDLVPSRNASSTTSKVLAGIALSLPLLIVVFALLASADPVFEYFFAQPPQWLLKLDITSGLSQILIAVGVYTFAAAYYWTLLHKPESLKQAQLLTLKRRHDPVIVTTILVLVNVIYILFVVIQFKYLFGGQDLSFLKEFTFAQYARQGFAQLLLITMINGVLVLMAVYSTTITHRIQTLLLKAVLTITCLLTIVIVASALYRMSLYQDAYGFTHLRIFVQVFEVWLGVMMLALMTRVIIHTFPFAKVFAVSAILTYVGLNCTNIDAMIAQKNLSASHDVVALDTNYLFDLSADAVDEQIQAMQANPYPTIMYGVDQGWQSWNYHKVKAAEKTNPAYKLR